MNYLRDNGFHIVVRKHEELTPTRTHLSVPDELMSCHTGEVCGYIVEGHVPAKEINRLLSERPNASGLSIPGTPLGSPGMETSYPPDLYNVLLFSDKGTRSYAIYVGTSPVTEPDGS
ncbi:DUF411 domain-containing protein [Henriciella sp.]|uniref:DUF411 domain-containing protein n=1 Tax=Henriciella sp. TaxID=1968823 RepID=UPI0026345EE9|nr:DUF411 domain-containing protein [Henriciella sp.]